MRRYNQLHHLDEETEAQGGYLSSSHTARGKRRKHWLQSPHSGNGECWHDEVASHEVQGLVYGPMCYGHNTSGMIQSYHYNANGSAQIQDVTAGSRKQVIWLFVFAVISSLSLSRRWDTVTNVLQIRILKEFMNSSWMTWSVGPILKPHKEPELCLFRKNDAVSDLTTLIYLIKVAFVFLMKKITSEINFWFFIVSYLKRIILPTMWWQVLGFNQIKFSRHLQQCHEFSLNLI